MKLIFKTKDCCSCPFAKLTKLEHLTPPSLWMIQFHVLHLLLQRKRSLRFYQAEEFRSEEMKKNENERKRKKNAKLTKNVVFVFEQHEIITHLRLEPLGNEGVNPQKAE